jgi:hypothetical protein
LLELAKQVPYSTRRKILQARRCRSQAHRAAPASSLAAAPEHPRRQREHRRVPAPWPASEARARHADPPHLRRRRPLGAVPHQTLRAIPPRDATPRQRCRPVGGGRRHRLAAEDCPACWPAASSMDTPWSAAPSCCRCYHH